LDDVSQGDQQSLTIVTQKRICRKQETDTPRICGVSVSLFLQAICSAATHALSHPDAATGAARLRCETH